VVLALGAHAVAIAILALVTIERRAVPAGTVEPRAPASTTSPPARDLAPPAPTFSFLAVDVERIPRAPLPGVGDAVGGDAHPMPRAPIDQPGARPADRGGGGPGGPNAWSGRRDRSDDALLRAEPWNGGVDYRSAHDDTHAPPRTTEAIHRAPVAATGDRQRAHAGAPGETAASRGDASGQGAGDAPRATLDADPIFDRAAGRTAEVRAPGASQASRDPAFAEVGAVAHDVARHGAPGDDRAVAASSDATRADAFDITPASSGGDDRGVHGDRGAGNLRDGSGPRGGTAASRADVAPGDAGLTVTAAAGDPYFRAFLRRLERTVVFPMELAKQLRSGRVIAHLRVAPDGSIHDLRIEVPSEFPDFDRALLTALRQMGALGPVPRRLLGLASGLDVRVPFVFSSPMIR